jgi:hypothetical protein
VQHAFASLVRTFVVTHFRRELVIACGKQLLDVRNVEIVLTGYGLLALKRTDLVEDRLA